MQGISFNLDNPQWKKEFPEYKTIISNAVKKHFRAKILVVKIIIFQFFLPQMKILKTLILNIEIKIRPLMCWHSQFRSQLKNRTILVI